jgi:hypothetical protein
MKLLSVVPALILVPMLTVSFPTNAKSERAITTKVEPVVAQVVTQVVNAPNESVLTQRKLRIQRLLISLDKVAAVAVQMKPENAERLEPVIVDLAEQTLNLVGQSEIQNVKTDSELDRLELTVGELANALSRTIEPEISL